MEKSNITILGSGNAAAQGSLDDSRLSGVCSTRMLIGPSSATGIIQSCEVVGISGAGFLSPTTTAPSLDCTLKCSVTVAVPSHQGHASFRTTDSNQSIQQISGTFGGDNSMTSFLTLKKEDDEEAAFDSLDLDNNNEDDDDEDDDQDEVPIGEILEKLQASSSPTFANRSARNGGNSCNLIRLHAAHDDSETPTISATVNVAALDLSDPDSIYRHLSQLNDTVLRVSTQNEDSPSGSGRQTPIHFIDSPPVHARDVLTPTPIHSPRSPSPSTETVLTSSNLTAISPIKCSTVDSSLSKTTFLPSSIQLPTSPLALATTCPTPSPSVLCSPSLQSVSSTSTPCSDQIPSSPIVLQGKNNSSLTKSSPQSCAICCKVFSNASALAKHRLTHSEERRYHCSICSKAFKRQDHLNGHLLTHRSTKPFACLVDGCGKSYCDARSLRRHKENHHSGASKQQHHTIVTIPPLSTAPTSLLTLTPKVVESVQAEPMIARSTLGDTKIMFSSKGLTAQQLQLIEQLLKESRGGKIVSLPTHQSFTPMPHQHPTTFTLPTIANSGSVSTVVTTPGLSSTIVKKGGSAADKTITIGDKPVECTICNRKFKNIPALNGHMRLHGGYYKKDSEGKRVPQTSNNVMQKMKGNNKFGVVVTKGGIKRKLSATIYPETIPEKKSSLCPISVQSSLSSLQPVTSAMLSIVSSNIKSTMPPSTPHFELRKPPMPQPSLAFQSLPPPDTNKLLENLERKNFGTISLKSESFEGFILNREKSKIVTHLSKGIGVKEQRPMLDQGLGRYSTSYGLPQVSLPTKPIPQLQLEERSHKPIHMKLEPILSNEVQVTKEESLDIKEELPFQEIHENLETISFPASCFPITEDSSASNNGNPFTSSASSIGINQFLTSSMLSCPVKSNPHQMLKVDNESDKTPKVGTDFQADIPMFVGDSEQLDDDQDLLLWNPDTLIDDVNIDEFLMLASSCAVPLGSHNEELALGLLQKHDGKVSEAVHDLLTRPSRRSLQLNVDDHIEDDDDDDADIQDAEFDDDSENSDPEMETVDHTGSQTCPWTELEVNAFYEGLVKYKKDFVKISQLIGTRTVKECVDFYYLWKNFCRDESTSFKSIFFCNSKDPSGRDPQGQDPESTSLQ